MSMLKVITWLARKHGGVFQPPAAGIGLSPGAPSTGPNVGIFLLAQVLELPLLWTTLQKWNLRFLRLFRMFYSLQIFCKCFF
jgi:hypothetical protein